MECKMWERSLLMGLCCLVMVGCGGSPKEASAAGRLAEAKRLVESGDFETARPLLEDLSWSGRDGVDAPETLWLLGRCLETLGDRSQAETIYYRCVKLNGGKNRFSIQAFAGLARLASSSGRPSSSERFLRRALNSKGSTRQHDEIRLLMATAAFDAGRRVEARQLLKAITTPALPGRSALEVRVNKGSMASNRPKVAPKNSVRIRTRREWRARPVNFRGRPTSLGRPYRITVHHGGEKVAAPTSLQGAAGRVRSYQSTHQVTNGWADIGYHFVIDASGRIWQGRELKWQGAHAGSPAANRGNIGICMMGDFDKVAPNYAQKKGLERLLKHLVSNHRISWTRVKGHNAVRRDHKLGSGTQCPGRHLQRALDLIKQRNAS